MGEKIKSIFHFYKTLESFNIHVAHGLISNDAICFIEETKQIYTNKNLFCINQKEYDALEKIVETHTNQLNRILGINVSESSDDAVNTFPEIISFLDGMSTSTNLVEYVAKIKEGLFDDVKQYLLSITNEIEDIKNHCDTIDSKIINVEKNIEYTNNNLQVVLSNNSALSTRVSNLITEFTSYKNYVTERFSIIENMFQLTSNRINDIELLYNEVNSSLNDLISTIQEHTLKFNDIDSKKGTAGGFLVLDENGLVPSINLPGYVDDILEFDGLVNFPLSGESGKVYLDKSTNLQYRWSGTQYVELSKSIGLGETSSTAFPGSRGKQLEDSVSNINTSINNINADLTTAKSNINTINTNISNINISIADINGDISNINNKVSDFDTKIVVNSENIASTQADVNNMKTTITSLNTNVTGINTSINSMQEDVTNLKNLKIHIVYSDINNPADVDITKTSGKYMGQRLTYEANKSTVGSDYTWIPLNDCVDKPVQTLTQEEYDSIEPENNVLYIISE